MPSNSTWACFDCRRTIRRANWPPSNEAAKCAHCGGECTLLGYKIPVPRRNDVRGWALLREQVQNAYINAESQQYEERIRRIHRLERHIAEMQAQPRNEGREQTLKDFRRELDMLRGSNAT